MRRRIGRLALVIGLALTRRAGAENAFEAVLSGAKEVPGPGMPSGSVRAVVVVDGRSATVRVTQGAQLLGGWHVFHLHRGADGASGRLVSEFTWTSDAPWTNTVSAGISEQDAARIAAEPEQFYLDVHTTAFPGGAARGQLAAKPEGAPPEPEPDLSSGIVTFPGTMFPVPAAGVPRDPFHPNIGPIVSPYAPAPGVGPRPEPAGASPSAFAFFFRLLEDLDAPATSAAAPAPWSLGTQIHAGLSAVMTESQEEVIHEIGVPCSLALAPLEERIRDADARGVPDEAARAWEERNAVTAGCIDRLRDLIGPMAFARLGAFVGERFDSAPNTLAPARLSQRREQVIRFQAPRSMLYRESRSLSASASSGLPVYYSATGNCSVSGGSLNGLSAGRCWITAYQPGDARFSPATSVEQQILVSKASQWIEGSGPEKKTYLDPDFPAGMAATSGLEVVFFAWGDCSANGTSLHITGAGTCAFTAHQPGDSNTLAAPIRDWRFPIAKADQKIEFAELPPEIYGAYDIPLWVKASSGLPVAFATSGPCVIVAGTLLRPIDSGTCTISVDQPGDRNFNPAERVTRTIHLVVPPPPPPPA